MSGVSYTFLYKKKKKFTELLKHVLIVNSKEGICKSFKYLLR